VHGPSCLQHEYCQPLSKELFFGVHSGLWPNNNRDEINWFNSDNTWDENGYELIGVLFGLALYNAVLFDVQFPLAVYCKMLSLHMHDMMLLNLIRSPLRVIPTPICSLARVTSRPRGHY